MPIKGAGGGSSISILDDLTDVTITSATLCNVLHFDGSIWHNLDSTTDWLSQYLYLPGRTNGQVLGSGAHTGGNTTDLVIENRLMFGDKLTGINYTTGRVLDIRHSMANGVIWSQFSPDVTSLTGVASGSPVILQIVGSGTFGYSSGTLANLRALFFVGNLTLPSGVSITNFVAGQFQGICQETGSAVATGWKTVIGVVADVRLPTIPNTLNTATLLIGFDSNVSNRSAVVTNVFGFRATAATGSVVGAVTNVVAYEVTNTFEASNTVTNWAGFRMLANFGSAGATPTNSWVLDIRPDAIPSRHVGNFSFGKLGVPAHFIDIAPGTTTVAAQHYDLGVLLTTALAGCEEYDGNYFYLTHSDAVRTKIVTQRGAVDLTAQAAAIGATTVYTPPAAGFYEVHYYLEDTTADVTAGTIQFQVNYTDDIGATNQVGAALVLTATGRDRGVFQLYCASGLISYQTNLVGIIGTSRYALRVRVEALG